MVGAGWVNAVLVGDHLPELEVKKNIHAHDASLNVICVFNTTVVYNC